MFIDKRAKQESQLRRSGMCELLPQSDDPYCAPPELPRRSESRFYRHFVPTGLIVLTFAVCLFFFASNSG